MSTGDDHPVHDIIKNAEEMARYLRIMTGGTLSLAVVRNYGATPKERQGLPWHTAHLMASEIVNPDVPPEGRRESGYDGKD